MDKTKKIFIADDDPDILEILALMLKTGGYDIETSMNANNVFNSYDPIPDLIILDIWMSGVDGRDIYKRLKENDNFRDVPILFISANSRLPEITKEFNATGYISKPFEMDDLLNKVYAVLHENGKNHA